MWAKVTRLLFGALGALGAVLAAGCGVQPHHTISSSSAAAQISARLSSRYGVENPAVTCPSSIPDKKGEHFSCTAVLDGQPVKMNGVVTGSGGSFTVTPDSAIVVVSSLESSVAQEIHKKIGGTPAVSCGARSVLVVPVGHSVSCTATFPGEAPRDVTVTVANLNGGFRLNLTAAGTP